jgi:hypothetical protein
MDPEASPAPVTPESFPGLAIGRHGPGLGRQHAPSAVDGVDFQGPGDLDPVRRGERRERRGGERSEDHIGQPGLTVGPCDEHAANLLAKNAPPEGRRIGQNAARDAARRRPRSEKTTPQTDDHADEPDRLEIEVGGCPVDERGRRTHDELEALPCIVDGNEGIERGATPPCFHVGVKPLRLPRAAAAPRSTPSSSRAPRRGRRACARRHGRGPGRVAPPAGGRRERARP